MSDSHLQWDAEGARKGQRRHLGNGIRSARGAPGNRRVAAPGYHRFCGWKHACSSSASPGCSCRARLGFRAVRLFLWVCLRDFQSCRMTLARPPASSNSEATSIKVRWTDDQGSHGATCIRPSVCIVRDPLGGTAECRRFQCRYSYPNFSLSFARNAFAGGQSGNFARTSLASAALRCHARNSSQCFALAVPSTTRASQAATSCLVTLG